MQQLLAYRRRRLHRLERRRLGAVKGRIGRCDQDGSWPRLLRGNLARFVLLSRSLQQRLPVLLLLWLFSSRFFCPSSSSAACVTAPWRGPSLRHVAQRRAAAMFKGAAGAVGLRLRAERFPDCFVVIPLQQP